MGRLCFCSVLCLLHLCARLFICALWSPAGKGLTSWLSFVVSNCECNFPIDILGQVWYLIVSIPNLCTLTYFVKVDRYKAVFLFGSFMLFLSCFVMLSCTSVVDALWSPAGKGLTSWLSFVMSNCDVVTFPSVSWVRCGA